MTAPRGTREARAASLALAGVLAAVAGCTSVYEVPIDTPIQAKLDVTPFSRVHVVGFISGGADDVDANMETVRLLRSQLRTKSRLRVIEADPLPAAAGRARPGEGPGDARGASRRAGAAPADAAAAMAFPEKILDEKDLEAFEPIFANAAYWKKIGEEFQQPLIVTGTVIFRPHQASGIVTQEREVYDQFGRRTVVPMRVYMERKGYILRPKLVFIDGRSGAVLYQESYREERLYPTPAERPGAVVLLRADGCRPAVVPEHAEHHPGPRLAHPAEVGAGLCPAVPSAFVIRPWAVRAFPASQHFGILKGTRLYGMLAVFVGPAFRVLVKRAGATTVFAIIQSGGRQVKVTPGEIVTVDRVDVEPGQEVVVEQVLLVGKDGGEVLVGAPFVAGARIVGTVAGESRGPKIRVFKKKRRKGMRRTKGHRATYTRIEVKDILV